MIVLLDGTGCTSGTRHPSPGTTTATAATGAGTSPGGPSATAGPPNPVPPVAGETMLGAYVDLSGMSSAAALALRRTQLGRDLRIIHLFYAWTDDLPRSFPGLPAGAIPMVSWRGASYQTVLDGGADAMVTADARRLAEYGHPVLLRWAWEMNGSWYDWDGTRNPTRTEGFIAAWRHLHDLFVAAHATNVAWVWAPNWYSSPNEAWNAPARYYPGDAYVDWVGVSGYSTTGQLPEQLFGPIYDQYADRKPIMIAETGMQERGGTVKADWIYALYSWILAHPALGALVWFDTDTDDPTKNRRIDSSPATLAAYRHLANDPHFSA